MRASLWRSPSGGSRIYEIADWTGVQFPATPPLSTPATGRKTRAVRVLGVHAGVVNNGVDRIRQAVKADEDNAAGHSGTSVRWGKLTNCERQRSGLRLATAGRVSGHGARRERSNRIPPLRLSQAEALNMYRGSSNPVRDRCLRLRKAKGSPGVISGASAFGRRQELRLDSGDGLTASKARG